MNNPQLYNAAFAGALAGIVARWSTDTVPADYAPIVDAAVAFAREVDSKIALDPLMSRAKAQNLDAICDAVLDGRFISSTNQNDYEAIAGGIAALYTEASSAIS